MAKIAVDWRATRQFDFPRYWGHCRCRRRYSIINESDSWRGLRCYASRITVRARSRQARVVVHIPPYPLSIEDHWGLLFTVRDSGRKIVFGKTQIPSRHMFLPLGVSRSASFESFRRIDIVKIIAVEEAPCPTVIIHVSDLRRPALAH